MANVNVNYDDVRRNSQQLKKAREDFESSLNRLKSMISSLTASGFKTDQASGKFDEAYKQWTAGAINVVGGLDGMAGYLDQVVAKHQELDAGVAHGAS